MLPSERTVYGYQPHTHTHTHANTQSNLFTPKFEHTPGQEHLHTLTIVRGLSDNLVMVHREQFDG